MRGLATASCLLTALLLGACSQDDDAPPSPPDNATALCVSADCGSKTRLLTIPDAENILFSKEGRLFVSGGTNVFEISVGTAGFAATPLYDGSANFTGLAIIGNTLYANSFDGHLYAASLTRTPQLQPIHDLALGAPNGLVDGPAGELYLVNGPLAPSALPDPKIVRLRLDPSDPFHVIEQTDWFSQNLLGPNGIQRRGNRLYVSNTGLGGLAEIRTVEINPDGTPGGSQQLLSFIGLPDDFTLVGDQLLVANFLTGEIGYYSAEGELLASSGALSYSSPSQVRVGQAPLFSATDVLVTEKGVIGDTYSPIGNALSVFRRNP